jgi:hypothetical protein
VALAGEDVIVSDHDLRYVEHRREAAVHDD